MKKKITKFINRTFICFLLLSSSLAYSQDANNQEIRGKIIDKENKEPLEKVSIRLYVKGGPSTYTNASGEFMFKVANLGLDQIFGRYRLSFYKAGYGTKSEIFDLPIRKDIELQKTSSGYIQVKEQDTNNMLEGIEIGNQEGTVEQTDRFGFCIIKIPEGAPTEKKYTFSIIGGYEFESRTIVLKVCDLKDQTVEIVLTRKIMNYYELINAYDNEMELFNKSLRDGKDGIKHIDRCGNILIILQKIKFTKEEKEDYDVRYWRMKKWYNEITKFDDKEFKKLESAYKKEEHEFNRLSANYSSNPPNLQRIPLRFKELIMQGQKVLDSAINIHKYIPFDDGELCKEVVGKQFKLNQTLENIIATKIPSDFIGRDQLKKELKDLIILNNENIEKSLISIKRQ